MYFRYIIYDLIFALYLVVCCFCGLKKSMVKLTIFMAKCKNKNKQDPYVPFYYLLRYFIFISRRNSKASLLSALENVSKVLYFLPHILQATKLALNLTSVVKWINFEQWEESL